MDNNYIITVLSFKSKMSINVSDVCKLVNNAEYSAMKEYCESIGICVKEKNEENQIFLLANSNDQKLQKNTQNKEKNSEILDNSINIDTDTVFSKFNEDLIKKQSNGIIFEKGTNKIICMSQNRMTELVDFSEVTKLVDQNDNIRIEYCEDGTLVKLYYYNEMWNTSTTRCISAKNSFWSSNKSFDSLFWETFDNNLLSTLDKSYTYIFILLHRENRIVVKHNVNMLVYVSRINNSSFVEDFTNQFRNVYGIKRPKMMDRYEFKKLAYDVNNYDCKYKRGIVIKVYDKNMNSWDLYKYDFESYKMIKNIRGNVPQIRMRYLELLSKPESLQLLENFYPEHTFMFTFIKASLLKLIKTVYKMYVDSHIKHLIQVDDTDPYYRTLRQLHAKYKITNNAIGFDDVQERIFSLDKMVIKKLLDWQ